MILHFCQIKPSSKRIFLSLHSKYKGKIINLFCWYTCNHYLENRFYSGIHLFSTLYNFFRHKVFHIKSILYLQIWRVQFKNYTVMIELYFWCLWNLMKYSNCINSKSIFRYSTNVYLKHVNAVKVIRHTRDKVPTGKLLCCAKWILS